MEPMSPTEIKSLRESLQLTATELAAQLGVTSDAVRKWERGERTPRGPALKLLKQIENLAKIPRGLGGKQARGKNGRKARKTG